jgi:hypothetical protein
MSKNISESITIKELKKHIDEICGACWYFEYDNVTK